jgi:hypothetical protein
VPPRFAYWTILIDNSPTAFRAREASELLPTLTQLKRTNPNVVLKWFARGRLWDTQQQERDDFHRRKWRPSGERSGTGVDRQERRPKDWRPGGDHKDPRARFSGRKQGEKSRSGRGPWQGQTATGERPLQGQDRQGNRPWRSKPNDRRPSGRDKGRFRPKPSGHPFKTKWKKDAGPHKKRDTPEDE